MKKRKVRGVPAVINIARCGRMMRSHQFSNTWASARTNPSDWQKLADVPEKKFEEELKAGMALIKPCCFWEYRRVAPDLLDREDELCHRLFVRLSKLEKGANRLLVRTLMRSFEADIERDMIPAEAMLEKFPDAISLPVAHGRDSSL